MVAAAARQPGTVGLLMQPAGGHPGQHRDPRHRHLADRRLLMAIATVRARVLPIVICLGFAAALPVSIALGHAGTLAQAALWLAVAIALTSNRTRISQPATPGN
jgi:hypothetical protein